MPWQSNGQESGFGDPAAGVDPPGAGADGGCVRRYGRHLSGRDSQRLCGGEPAGMVLHGAFIYDPGKEEKLGDTQISGQADLSSAKAAAAVCRAGGDFAGNHDDGACDLGKDVSGVASGGQSGLSAAGRTSGADHNRPCARSGETDEMFGELRLFCAATCHGRSAAGRGCDALQRRVLASGHGSRNYGCYESGRNATGGADRAAA